MLCSNKASEHAAIHVQNRLTWLHIPNSHKVDCMRYRSFHMDPCNGGCCSWGTHDQVDEPDVVVSLAVALHMKDFILLDLACAQKV